MERLKDLVDNTEKYLQLSKEYTNKWIISKERLELWAIDFIERRYGFQVDPNRSFHIHIIDGMLVITYYNPRLKAHDHIKIDIEKEDFVEED